MLLFSQSIAQIEYKAPGILKKPTKIIPERQKELHASHLWQGFISKFGSQYTVRWNEKRGTPRVIMGKGLNFPESINATTIEKVSLEFLRSLKDYLNIKLSELRFLNYKESKGQTHVFFEQYYRGLKVFGTQVKFNINKYGRVNHIRSDFYPDIDISIQPVFTEENALNKIKSYVSYNDQLDLIRKKELIIIPVENENGYNYKLAWDIEVLKNERREIIDFFIDANNGDYLFIRKPGNNYMGITSGILNKDGKDVHDKRKTKTASVSTSDYTVSGTVTGKVYPNYPSDQLQTYNIEHNYVLIYDDQYEYIDNVLTDQDGDYELTGQDEGTYYAKSWLRSPYIKVTYDDGDDAEHTWDLTWCWDGDDINVYDEPNVFYHINWIHDYFKASPFNFDLLDFQIEAVVRSGYIDSISQGCNASCRFYMKKFDFGSGGTTNYYDTCSTYSGTSFDDTWTFTNYALNKDVIFHEYTHAVIDTIYNAPYNGIGEYPGSESLVMDEAFPDFFACTTDGDSLQGEGTISYSSTDPFTRHLRNSYTMDDWNNTDFSVSSNLRAQIFNGALWDLRTSIGASNANEIIFNALYGKAYTFIDYRDELLVADDNENGDDDLSNGTPNSYQIMWAFYSHKIDSFYVTISGPSGLEYMEQGQFASSITTDSGYCTVEWFHRWEDSGTWNSLGYGATKTYKLVDTKGFYLKAIAIDTLKGAVDTSNVKFVDYIAGKKVAVSFPEKFELYQNYPNPFNPVTTIKFDVPEETDIIIKIFNILGEEIVTLTNMRYRPGTYKIKWDGTNEMGIKVGSGIYIYKIRSKNYIHSRKMLLLK